MLRPCSSFSRFRPATLSGYFLPLPFFNPQTCGRAEAADPLSGYFLPLPFFNSSTSASESRAAVSCNFWWPTSGNRRWAAWTHLETSLEDEKHRLGLAEVAVGRRLAELRRTVPGCHRSWRRCWVGHGIHRWPLTPVQRRAVPPAATARRATWRIPAAAASVTARPCRLRPEMPARFGSSKWRRGAPPARAGRLWS